MDANVIELDSGSDSIPEQDSSSSDSDTGRSSVYGSTGLKIKMKPRPKAASRAQSLMPKNRREKSGGGADTVASSGGRALSLSRSVSRVEPVQSSLEKFKKLFPHLDIGHGRRILKMNGHTVVAEELPKPVAADKPQKSKLLLNRQTPALPTARAHKVTPKRRSTTISSSSSSSIITTNTITTTYNNDSSTNSTRNNTTDTATNSSQDSIRGKHKDPSYAPPSSKRPRRSAALGPKRASMREASARITMAAAATAKSAARGKSKESKPGTAGSRQAAAPTRKSKLSEIEGILLLHNGRRIQKEKTLLKPIDTGCMVDDTIVSFILEIGQREQLDTLPRDPRRLCKQFSILLPNCDVARLQAEQEQQVSDKSPKPPLVEPAAEQPATQEETSNIKNIETNDNGTSNDDSPMEPEPVQDLLKELGDDSEKVEIIDDKPDSSEDYLAIDPAEISPILD